jgi:hypothetical protein
VVRLRATKEVLHETLPPNKAGSSRAQFQSASLPGAQLCRFSWREHVGWSLLSYGGSLLVVYGAEWRMTLVQVAVPKEPAATQCDSQDLM